MRAYLHQHLAHEKQNKFKTYTLPDSDLDSVCVYVQIWRPNLIKKYNTRKQKKKKKKHKRAHM